MKAKYRVTIASAKGVSRTSGLTHQQVGRVILSAPRRARAITVSKWDEHNQEYFLHRIIK